VARAGPRAAHGRIALGAPSPSGRQASNNELS
jgi:hypothetical protein